MIQMRAIAASLLGLGFLLTSCNATSSSLQREGRYGPGKGESEISFAATLTNQSIDPDQGDSIDVQTVFLQVAGGYFLDENQEIGGTLNVFNFDADGSDGGAIGLYPYWRWNFRGEGRGWFYAGGQLGLNRAEFDGDSDTTIAFGGHGGYKHWLRPDLALFVEPRLNFYDQDFGDTVEFLTLFGIALTL